MSEVESVPSWFYYQSGARQNRALECPPRSAAAQLFHILLIQQ